MSAFRIQGLVQPYAWGSRSFIADLLGRPTSGGPEAELWFGAHSRGPCELLGGPDDACTLADLIARDPARVLGPAVAERFGGRLPFLFKVLAADQPLSLQVHPTLAQARAGFADEESRGVPRDASTRNYKDDNHKPELICALTRFEALSGFREPRESVSLLSRFGLGDPGAPLFDAFRRFLAAPDTSGLRRFFESIFRTERAALRTTVDRMVEAACRERALDDEETRVAGRVVRRLAASYPDDPGVVASLLLRYVVLEPGEALFLDAGNLHAYLSGAGLELMASSDNVLRGGLTEKHVDLAELLRVVQFQSFLPEVRRGETRAADRGARVVYATSAPEFELSLFAGQDGALVDRGPCVLLCLEGAFELEAGTTRASLRRGDSFFCTAETAFTLTGVGRCALAGVNARA